MFHSAVFTKNNSNIILIRRSVPALRDPEDVA